jgi:hypothetical protein
MQLQTKSGGLGRPLDAEDEATVVRRVVAKVRARLER